MVICSPGPRLPSIQITSLQSNHLIYFLKIIINEGKKMIETTPISGIYTYDQKRSILFEIN